MRYLADRQGKVASRIALESDVWGYDYHGGSNVVDAVVRSLRKKLADKAALIETVHGATTGYGDAEASPAGRDPYGTRAEPAHPRVLGHTDSPHRPYLRSDYSQLGAIGLFESVFHGASRRQPERASA